MSRWVSLAAVVAVTLTCAPAAFADSAQSSNWAGYAVHRSGVTFSKVVGAWTQPRATCTPGRPTYSSVWVGIGGYSTASQALEQIGTEADCTAGGHAVSSAWYELVPAPSRTTTLLINPGDRVRAGVSLAAHQVTLTINDLTRHRSFTKSLHVALLDTTSAEWIVEAPSVCSSSSTFSCQTLPLADFGSTGFSSAGAESAAGHTGTIDDRHWSATRISLAEGGHHFIGMGGPPGSGGLTVAAVPSMLVADGSAFTVTYQGPTTGVTTTETRRIAAPLVHLGPLSPSS